MFLKMTGTREGKMGGNFKLPPILINIFLDKDGVTEQVAFVILQRPVFVVRAYRARTGLCKMTNTYGDNHDGTATFIEGKMGGNFKLPPIL